MPGPRVAADEQPAVWATFLAQLWAWVADHGDALVPTTATTTVDGARYHLGSRVKNARVYYRRDSLIRRQTEQLEALPGWSWPGRSPWTSGGPPPGAGYRQDDQAAAIGLQVSAVHGMT